MITCRPLQRWEAYAAAELESLCLSTAWSEAQIADWLETEGSLYLAAFQEGELCGILSASCLCGDCEILNLAVSPSFRHRGIGTKLLMEALEELNNRSCEVITLEVAEDNESAIALYEKCGFCKIGLRKNFYKGRNAVVMQKPN